MNLVDYPFDCHVLLLDCNESMIWLERGMESLLMAPISVHHSAHIEKLHEAIGRIHLRMTVPSLFNKQNHARYMDIVQIVLQLCSRLLAPKR